MTAKATDSAGNAASTTNTFTYMTSPPSVAVTYPIASTSFGATDLKNNSSSPCSSGAACSLSSDVTTTSGDTELVLVYYATTTSGVSVTSVTGSALSGSPNQITSEVVDGGDDTMFAWQGTGSGTSNGTVTVNFTTGDSGDPIIVDVLQLAAGDSVVQSGVDNGDSGSATVQLNVQNSSDAEVAFVATSSDETVTKPSAFTSLDSNEGGTDGSAYGYDTSDDTTVTSSTTSEIDGGVGNHDWGSIALEISDAPNYGANWSGSIAGTASSNAGTGTSISSVGVAIKNLTTSEWWNGSAFSGSSADYIAANYSSPNWSLSFPASDLVAGDSYAVTAQATDSLSNVGTSSAATFNYDNTAPTVALTYPTSGDTYGSNWAGAITGSATTKASGSSISNVGVAIEQGTGDWWNGSSFSATTETFEPVSSGTTSWSYTLSSSAFTSGDTYHVYAQATDSYTNVGTSSEVSFTYSNIGLVQQNSITPAANASSVTPTLTSGVTDGDALILVVADESDNSAIVSSVSGGGVTWAKATSTGTSANGDAEIWYGLDSSGTSGSTVITVTLNHSTNVQIADVSEWSGLATSGALDQSTNANNTTASISAGSVTPTVSGELIISDAYLLNGNTTQPTPTSGFASLTQMPGESGNYRGYGAYLVDGSSSSISTTWTEPGGAGAWSAAIATFKP